MYGVLPRKPLHTSKINMKYDVLSAQAISYIILQMRLFVVGEIR
jgi:hypothetical protein